MSSYFDAQPHSKTTAEVAGSPFGDNNEGLRANVLTPQVSRILDDLEGHYSSSDSESESEPDQDEAPDAKLKVRKDSATGQALQEKGGSDLSSGNNAKTADHPLPRVKRHPRLERFVSLRSSLLSSRIADNLSKMSAEEDKQCQRREQQWSNLNQADGSAESQRDSGSSEKKTLARRMGNTLRKITSRDVPTMQNIQEEGNDSRGRTQTRGESASSQDNKKRYSGLEFSDDDGMARSTSKQVPESDGKAQSRLQKEQEEVNKLVRMASKRPQSAEDVGNDREQAEYSDASTATDSEADDENGLADHDINELIQWMSRNKGAKEQLIKEGTLPTQVLQESSDNPSKDSTRDEAKPEERESNHNEDDDASSSGDEDVATLIRTVTREECTQEDEKRREAAILKWKLEKERQEKLGRVDSQHQGTLTDADVDELVKCMSRK